MVSAPSSWSRCLSASCHAGQQGQREDGRGRRRGERAADPAPHPADESAPRGAGRSARTVAGESEWHSVTQMDGEVLKVNG